MKIFSAQFLRPAALFCLFMAILAISTHQRIYSRSWHEPLQVTVYPINGDGTMATHNYIARLQQQHFNQINQWFTREAKRYSLPVQTPFNVTLGDQVKASPPQFPPNAGVIRTLLWGLHLRYWVYRNTPDAHSNLRRVRVFVVYQQGEDDVPLAHSIGLQKGLIGVVNAFSLDRQTEQNNIIIAHELLHTVGATDKYDTIGNPLYPIGYANPGRSPLHPQRHAEVMAARVPLSTYSSRMATSLRSTVINPVTAREIAWLEESD